MVKTIGRNTNTNDVGDDKATVTLNSTTATKVLDANDDRINAEVMNFSNHFIFIKEQAASVDNVKTGEPVAPWGNYKTRPDNMYTGEISAISLEGSPVVYPKEL